MILPILFMLLPSLLAYTIDDSCNAFANVPEAIQEAINMALYAEWRIGQANPPIGEAAGQLIGSRAMTVFPERMRDAVDALGPNNGRWNANNPPLDNKVVVTCGDGHLFFDQAAEAWKDRDFPRMRGIVLGGKPSSVRPCTRDSGEMARTYLTGHMTGNLPRFAMMLCEGWENAALAKPAMFGTRWETEQWNEVPFGRFAHEATSVTIVHEAMHCIYPTRDKAGLTGRLPSQIREVYSWNRIRRLEDRDKEVNANSYALLAAALWLKANQIGPEGRMGSRYHIGSGYLSLHMPNDPHPM